MNEIRSEIVLEAPVERIWELLADCSLYPQWNPLFPRVTGQFKPCEQVELAVKLPEIGLFTIQSTIQEYEARTKLCWQHRSRFPGLYSWSYCCTLKSLESNRVEFSQRSTFGGLLAPLLQFGMGKMVSQGLAAMNSALKRWGEKGNIQCLKC